MPWAMPSYTFAKIFNSSVIQKQVTAGVVVGADYANQGYDFSQFCCFADAYNV